MNVENLKRTVAEMFPPAVLFSQDLRDLPGLYSELRNFLDSRGANMTPHSSGRVMLTLATNLYEEPEDTLAATEIVREIVAAGRRRNVQSDITSTPSASTHARSHADPSSTSTERIAHNVAMRLKENERKFSGHLGENWMEFVDEYMQIARDYNLSPDQKLQYLRNALRGDAKRNYLDRVDGYAASYQQAVEMINNEYNSPVRQTRVKNYLNSLRLSSFEAKGTETSAALSQVYRIITKFSRQAPRSHQGDAHKIEFLRNAVVGQAWSHEPLSRVPTHNLTFQMLYGELEAALQLHKEAKLATLRDRAETGQRGNFERASSTFYQGQGRYLKNTSTFRRNRAGHSDPKERKQFNPLSIQGCFNCDSPDHMVNKCPHPLNVARAATRKVDYYSKKEKDRPYAVHQVLADLCMQLNGTSFSEGADEEISTDVDVFQSLLSYPASNDITITDINEAHEAEAPDNNIYVISYELANTYVDEFLGACIDSAAQRTFIGKPQAEMCGKRCGTPIKLEASAGKPSFSFGTHRHPGLGRIEIRFPISGTHFMPLMVDVVNIDIPFLLGLDTMKAYGMVLDTDKETLSSNFDGWKIPLVQKLGHLYHEWDIRILFTEAELRKVHRHFFHPKPEKFYELIRIAKPDTTSPEVLRDLERIGATCGPCQQFATAPHRFKVSLRNGEIVFNREVCLDLMSLYKSTVLHAVDRDTKFNVARFLRGESAESTWNTFRKMWISAYAGNPDIISADQGPQFRSKYWRNVTNLAGIELKLSGVESHNAINVGEKYHDFLRRIFHKGRKDYPQLSENDILSLFVKALNDTAGPRGLVPTLLVFGVLPKIPFVPTELPTQAQRMRAMDAARTEMNKVVAETRLNLALKAKAPGAASSFDDIKIGSKVLVYREKLIDMWKGPYTMLDVEGKLCRIDANGRTSQFSIDKVKLYHIPSIEEHAYASHDQTGSSGDDTTGPSPESLLEKEADAIEPTDTIGLDGVPPSQSSQHPLDDSEVIDRWHGILVDVPNDEFGKDIQDLEDLQISTSRPDELFGDKNFDINVTEVLNPNDPRGRRAKFDAAKREEVSSIQKRDIWDVVKEENIPPNANVLSGRFVQAYRNHGTPKQLVKARYVAQEHKDKDKGFVVHNVTTLRVGSTRVLVSVAAVKGLRIYSDDVRQAYLQNEHDLTREIYLKPKRDDREGFGLKEGEALKLKKPIYGIPDALGTTGM